MARRSSTVSQRPASPRGALPRPESQRRAPAVGSGLERHVVAAQAEKLLKERARLLRAVQKKKDQLEQFRRRVEREAEQAAPQVGALVARHEGLVRELKLLFQELLAPGRLTKKAVKQVLRVRRMLTEQGLLSEAESDLGPGHSGAAFDDEDAWGADEQDFGGQRAGSGRGRSRRAADANANANADADVNSDGARVASAPKPDAQRRSLRDVFRSLARAVHPDQARHEPERARRTEVMKEVTRAYEQGDLARLVELEQTWRSEQAIGDDADPEARCRELERTNRELLDQVRQLTRELRDAKRNEQSFSGGLSLEQVLEQATRELDQVSAVVDFVRQFRDGKIGLAEFARGPVLWQDLEVGQGAAEDAELARFLDELIWTEIEHVTARPSRRKTTGRPNARSGRSK